MTTTATEQEATFLDDGLEKVEPAEVKFTGDIVDVWRRDGNPDYDKPERPDPPKVKFIFRDYVESADREEPRLRYSKWMSISTHPRAELSKFRKSIERQISATPTTWRQFVGLVGDWSIKDIERGDFSSLDVPACEGKPTVPAPNPLPVYVPKKKDEDTDTPSEPDGSAEVTDEAKTAFVTTIEQADPDNAGLSEAAIRKLFSQNMDYRQSYPAAFAMIVTGKLIREQLVERAGKYFAD